MQRRTVSGIKKKINSNNMETIKVKLYDFNELSPEAQADAIAGNEDINILDDWFEPVIEGFVEDMKGLDHEIDPKDISFSGFYSQGDGASFTTENGSLSAETLVKLVIGESEDSEVYSVDAANLMKEAAKNGELEFELVRTTHRHVHQNTVELRSEYTGDSVHAHTVLDGMHSAIENKLRTYMRNLYDKLEEYYTELRSDEAVKETLVINEFKYLEDGRQWMD